MGSHSTWRREKKKQLLGGNAYISLKCLLSGCEVRGETASSRLSFSSRSKIDSCIHWRKGERSWGACRVYPQPPPLLPLSLSHRYEKLTTAHLLWERERGRERERCFLLHRPYSPFSSDSAKLFAFVGPVCRPFSHLSPPVRFTTRQGQVWPVNLWRLRCLPVVRWREHVEHQKFMERLDIVPFISREMERKSERRFRMCGRFIWQIEGGICGAGDHFFPHFSL